MESHSLILFVLNGTNVLCVLNQKYTPLLSVFAMILFECLYGIRIFLPLIDVHYCVYIRLSSTHFIHEETQLKSQICMTFEHKLPSCFIRL